MTHPVGRPAATRFEKGKANIGIFLQHVTVKKRRQCHHIRNRHRDHVGGKGVIKKILPWHGVNAGNTVHGYSSFQVISPSEKDFEVRVAEHPLTEKRRDHRAAKTPRLVRRDFPQLAPDRYSERRSPARKPPYQGAKISRRRT